MCGRTALYVSHDGSVFICPYLCSVPEMSLGNIKQETLSCIWNEHIRSVEKENRPNECYECEYWQICGNGCLASNYFRTGSLHSYSRDCQDMKRVAGETQLIPSLGRGAAQ